MLLVIAAAFILFAFIALKLFGGMLKLVFHLLGWIIAIALIIYWFNADHAGASTMTSLLQTLKA